MKKNKELVNTTRMPSVEECEDCKYKDKCEGGKYCVNAPKKYVKKKYKINIVN